MVEAVVMAVAESAEPDVIVTEKTETEMTTVDEETKTSVEQATVVPPPSLPQTELTTAVTSKSSQSTTTVHNNQPDDENCIYIDDDQLLDKSDIIKSFIATSEDNNNKEMKNGSLEINEKEKEDEVEEGEVEEEDAEDDDESIGSSLDDFNYYNTRLDDSSEDDLVIKEGSDNEDIDVIRYIIDIILRLKRVKYSRFSIYHFISWLSAGNTDKLVNRDFLIFLTISELKCIKYIVNMANV
jgi:hypothetical protein